MSEKSKKSNGEQKKEGGGGGEGKKKESGGGKGNAANATVVLKLDLLHCDGCVSRVLKCIRSSEGVDTANIGDGLITVVGKVDPAKILERVLKKTGKKVELVSPQANKNGDGKEKGKGKENSGNAKEEKKKDLNDKNAGKKSDAKKEKEPPVTTAVLKVHLHCEGCIRKIRKYVTKTKGYKDMKIDKQKETVTVTGALDVKVLVEVLKKHLKREVQIVPPKKEAEKKENPGGGGKAKPGVEKGKSGGDDGEKSGGGEKMEGNKVQMQVAYPYPYPYPYPVVYERGVPIDQFHYNPYPYGFGSYHAPQMFSDENPNACSVM